MLRKIFHPSINEKIVVVTAAVVILALIVDMELSNVADIPSKRIGPEKGVVTFIIISVIYLFGQYQLVRFAQAKTVQFSSGQQERR